MKGQDKTGQHRPAQIEKHTEADTDTTDTDTDRQKGADMQTDRRTDRQNAGADKWTDRLTYRHRRRQTQTPCRRRSSKCTALEAIRDSLVAPLPIEAQALVSRK